MSEQHLGLVHFPQNHPTEQRKDYKGLRLAKKGRSGWNPPPAIPTAFHRLLVNDPAKLPYDWDRHFLQSLGEVR